MNAHRKQQGIALVTVLGIAMVVLALLMVVTNVTVRGARVTSRDVTSIQLVQLADGYSDQARLTLAQNYVNSKLSLSKWIGKITPNVNAIPQVISPTDPKVSALAGIHERKVTLGGATLRWKIKKVSVKQASKASIEVHTTAIDSSGNAQTVIRQVWFGDNEIFDLALLSERVDCMFCHLTVKGDVGSLNVLRPGWGSENDGKPCGPDNDCGIGSGKDSVIDGDVYSSKTVTKDKIGTNDINGATLTAGKKLNENYTGDKLPEGDDGKPAFPGLDRALIKGSASGSLTGGSIRTVAPDGTWSSGPGTASGISKTFDGNVVLEGTAANPIVLNGDVYVSGDVVIKGVVTGRGAIYAGRNMYIAGNLTNKNRPDKPGAAGLCKDIVDDDAGRNECAVKNINAGKDETRLSAGNNMILGDYTEQKADLSLTSVRDRQSADYYRSQFGLYPGQTRYVRKGSSEELRYDSDRKKYFDQVNREVNDSEVQAVGGAGTDPYRPLIAPGSMNDSGNFNSWLSDAEYQSILGSESIPNNTWRSEYGAKSNEAIPEADKIAKFTAELEDAGLPKDSPQTLEIATALAKRTALEKYKYNGLDQDGKMVSGYVNVSLDDKGNPTLRVSVNEARKYRQETTALEAFLYANSRIAGKLSPRGGYINGGMIARQIGVLAPGKNADNGWWIADDAERKAFTNCDRVARPTDTNEDAANVGTNCNYSINYDYRLRNGGYGYNYYRGVTGATREWKLDDTGAAKVEVEP
jgi:hypothetical protein